MLSCFWEEDESLCSILNGEGKGVYLYDGHFPVRLQRKLSRKKLREFSWYFSLALSSLGIKPGEVVAMLLPNFTEFPIAYFGILRNGCIVAPTNVRFSEFEIQSLIKKFSVKHVVVLEKFYPMVSKIDTLKNIIVLRVSDTLPFIKGLVYSAKAYKEKNLIDIPKDDSRVFDFYDFLKRGRRFFSSSCFRVRRKDEALILFTSGTTGTPKLVVHTHESLLENTYACKRIFSELINNENAENEVFLAAAPYFHITGISTMLHLPFLLGSKIVMVPNPSEDNMMLSAISSVSASVFVGVPKMYEKILKDFELVREQNAFAHSSLKVCISGSVEMPDNIRKNFRRTFGKEILEGYGMSEAGITHCQKDGFNFEGSVGPPLNGIEHKILEPDSDRIGEILVRGKSLMKGYVGDLEDEIFIDGDGWLHTGDLGEVSKNGELFLTGRKKDLIKGQNGENIYPSQIEQIIKSYYLVKESAVVEKKIEGKDVIVAYVVLKDFLDAKSKDEIREELFLLSKSKLSSIKLPKEINFIAELPKNILGKVLKKDLR